MSIRQHHRRALVAQRQTRGCLLEELHLNGRVDARPDGAIIVDKFGGAMEAPPCSATLHKGIPPPQKQSQRQRQQPNQRQNRGSAVQLRVESNVQLKLTALLSCLRGRLHHPFPPRNCLEVQAKALRCTPSPGPAITREWTNDDDTKTPRIHSSRSAPAPESRQPTLHFWASLFPDSAERSAGRTRQGAAALRDHSRLQR